MTPIRLDKFISERTEYSRSQIKQLVSRKSVTVDGQVIKNSDMKINPDTAKVTVNGNEIRTERYRYILLNKPEGYVCSTSDNDGESVMNLIPENMRTKNMFPAGRLDKDSLGALLITDDGDLAHRILSPKRHISKIYIVKLDRPFKSEYINLFKNGLELGNGEVCLPADVSMCKTSEKLAFIQLFEGKYHQIKRMFSAVGNHVEVLMRVSLGSLILPETLGFGECMELLHKDVENLFLPLDFNGFCRDFSGIFSSNLINKRP
ncbi:MAG: 16S rRNA pseudouridine(516) synthase [Ruminococcus flavefaciens]|nr:16S rRNA pseudouridine(516) synthase [Ruminococcus flavefaciens]